MMSFMMLFGFLAIVGVALLVALAIWFVVRRWQAAGARDSALDILRERYARLSETSISQLIMTPPCSPCLPARIVRNLPHDMRQPKH